jgi:type I restriction enzyme R subunit
MARLNKMRSKFLEKFQQLVDEYNAGAINVEVFFNRLKDFAGDLNEEDKRGLSENLTEEELAIFDLLYKSDLAKKEKDKVKLVSKTLLEKLKREKLVLEWRKRQQTRADVLLTIEMTLEELPDSYTKPVYQEKCNLVYQHVYDSYYGSGKSIYQMA